MQSGPIPGERIAYFGRVSTPKQKLEHHWETVERWLLRNGLQIPAEWRFEDKIRRHEAASMFRDWDKRKLNPSRKRYRFDALMELVEAKQLDWIIIASFDRWGIADKDEIFVFRSKLRQYNVQLYSVVDELNITSADDSSFWRVAGAAEGATRYVSQQAEKNIEKMVSMAEHGWAATGNAPFGLDLVCYPVNDLTRPLFRVVRMRYKPHQCTVITYSPDSRVERDGNGWIVSSLVTVVSTVLSENMPPRDKKATGYRYERSIESERIKAVNRMFELYLKGMEFSKISDALWDEGFKHYDKPFGYHGIETILANSAYIGLPAWGKVGVGEYRHCLGKQPKLAKRNPTDTVTLKKPEEEYIYPLKAIFASLVPLELFNSVKEKLKNRPHFNESFGKRRIRDKTTHPLNGKLFCPDCGGPMVLGSFTPGRKTLAKSKGKARHKRCFICGTYRKSIRRKCFANTVRWELLNEAVEKLLKVVSDRIEAVQKGKFSASDAREWLLASELGKLLVWIGWAAKGQISLYGPIAADRKRANPKKYSAEFVKAAFDQLVAEIEEIGETGLQNTNPEKFGAAIMSLLLNKPPSFLTSDDPSDVLVQYQSVFAAYDLRFEDETAELKSEMTAIDEELDSIALELPKQRSKPSIYERLNRRASELEKRKLEIEPKLHPLTGRAREIIAQVGSIKQTIESADTARMGKLLDSFLEKVEPVFETKMCKDKKRRAYVTGFRFVPKDEGKLILPEAMEIGVSRKGTGSSPRPASSSRERWRCRSRARS